MQKARGIATSENAPPVTCHVTGGEMAILASLWLAEIRYAKRQGYICGALLLLKVHFRTSIMLNNIKSLFFNLERCIS